MDEKEKTQKIRVQPHSCGFGWCGSARGSSPSVFCTLLFGRACSQSLFGLITSVYILLRIEPSQVFRNEQIVLAGLHRRLTSH